MTTYANTHDDPVIIYTDGACRVNPGPGGWGATLRRGSQYKELCGGHPDSTNNRMELTAAIKALAALKKPLCVVVYTDSQYVKNGISEWLKGWKARSWKTSAGKPVLNEDLWRKLDELNQQHDVVWRWVKGHAGNKGNERADELANRGMAAKGPTDPHKVQ